MKDDYILQVKGLTKEFPGVIALDNVDFAVKRGEVHALVGENGAGKSTLMKCLLGLYHQDSGEILLNGEHFIPKSPEHALNSGISMIHQELSLVPTMTVSENIWLGREKKFSQMGIIDIKRRDEATAELLEEYGLSFIKPNALVDRQLSVANMQLVEILRAISYSSEIIIMDEPTSALTRTEIDILFDIIHKLKERGVTIIFISHKLDEIFEIADTLTALRDGHTIETRSTEGLTENELIKLIVGREVSEQFPKLPAEIGEVVLEVKNLQSTGVFRDVTFSVRKGEILGLCGLMGAGRSEIARAVFGIDGYDSGTVSVEGKPLPKRNTKVSIENGMGMVTEDRRRMGIFSDLPVGFNTIIANLGKLCHRGFVKDKLALQEAKTILERLSTKYSNLNQAISSLSGGNQQKVIIGRWMMTNPKVLILDEPTRGIDVGSKSEIHRLISLLAQRGVAIIMVSSELPEVMGMSDRILTIRGGRIVAQHSRAEADPETLMKYAFGTIAPMKLMEDTL